MAYKYVLQQIKIISMRKSFRNLRNEKGYILPFSFLLAILVIGTLFHLIIIYQNEQVITKRILEQLQLESMVQMNQQEIWMAYKDKGEELVQGEHYSYPY